MCVCVRMYQQEKDRLYIVGNCNTKKFDLFFSHTLFNKVPPTPTVCLFICLAPTFWHSYFILCPLLKRQYPKIWKKRTSFREKIPWNTPFSENVSIVLVLHFTSFFSYFLQILRTMTKLTVLTFFFYKNSMVLHKYSLCENIQKKKKNV